MKINNGDTALESGMSLAVQTVQSWSTSFYEHLPNLIVGIFFLLVFTGLAYSLKRTVHSIFIRRDRQDLGLILSDFSFWTMQVLGVLMVLMIIIPSVNPADLLASLGLGSVALGFAFKDILQNWLAGLLILLRMPFRRGDQVIVSAIEGTVIRIEPRATIIRTYDGRDVIVPNTQVYTGVVTINTSQNKRRIEINLTVGYAYKVRTIQKIIEKAIAPIEEILKDPAPQILCTELGSTSLALQVRWWILPSQSNAVISKSRAVQAIKEAFEANDIDPTDPQLVYYQSDKGKGTNIAPPEDPSEIRSFSAPPKIQINKEDPETERLKIDPKDKTLLPDTE